MNHAKAVLAIPLLVLMCMAQGAFAQNGTAAPACNGPNAGPPEELAGWAKSPVPASTAHDSEEALRRSVALGQRVTLTLAKTDTIKFAHAPTEQMPKQYVYSGMISFHVPKDGAYSVMISEANWIDVVQNGQSIQSLDMRGRVPCAKYGKKIDFPLKSGEAIVQFFGAPYETVDVLIAPVQ
jgi:hypothetical protein